MIPYLPRLSRLQEAAIRLHFGIKGGDTSPARGLNAGAVANIVTEALARIRQMMHEQ